MAEHLLTHGQVVDLLEHGGTAHPRRPLILATALILKAKRHPSVKEIRLESLVTPASLGTWDLDAVEAAIGGLGIHTRQHHLSQAWTEIRLVRTEADRPVRATGQLRAKLSVYVRFLETLGDWRVHLLSAPGIPLSALA